jgi:hypothetical protein
MTRLHVLQHRQVFVPLYVQLDGVAPQIERLEPLPDLSAVCGLLQQPPGLRQPRRLRLFPGDRACFG